MPLAGVVYRLALPAIVLGVVMGLVQPLWQLKVHGIQRLSWEHGGSAGKLLTGTLYLRHRVKRKLDAVVLGIALSGYAILIININSR
jgi:hypothetical protein